MLANTVHLHRIVPFPGAVERLFDLLEPQDPRRPGALVPMDAIRGDHAIRLVLSVPGLTPEGLQVSVASNRLSIEGEIQCAQAPENDHILWSEIPCGKFSRSVALPEGVDAGSVTAHLENGLLTVTIPIPEPDKPHPVPILTDSSP